jgi:preprotein translocase subunit SecE
MIKKIQQFIKDVQIEMGKVAWPTRKELLNSSVIVVVVSVIFTLYILFADTIIYQVVQLFYQ